MDYWYQVEDRYARPGRPAYDASGGYLGLRLQFSYRVPVTERLSVTTGGRLENFCGRRQCGQPAVPLGVQCDAGRRPVLFPLPFGGATVASASEPFD